MDVQEEAKLKTDAAITAATIRRVAIDVARLPSRRRCDAV